MKKLLLVAMVWIPAALLAQSPAMPSFSITGKITGLPDQSGVSISDVNNPSDTLARAIVKKGKFLLTGSVAEPNLYQLNFAGAKKKSTLFIGNDTMQVTGNMNDVENLEVTGSPSNEDFVEFEHIFNPLFKRLSELNKLAYSTPDFQQNDSLMSIYRDQFEKISSAIDKFILNKKSSPVSPFLLAVTSQVEHDDNLLEKRFNTLDPLVQDGFYGKILAAEIAKSKIGAVGSQAMDFSQDDTSGRKVSLSDFRGKYVLLDFWASWCRPCRMENPNVVAAYNKFKGKNFTILSVSLDKEREPWIEAINADHLTWTQVSDLKFWYNEVAQKYNIEQIPQNFLIDPNGNIIAKNLRGEALDDKLCEVLGCN